MAIIITLIIFVKDFNFNTANLNSGEKFENLSTSTSTINEEWVRVLENFNPNEQEHVAVDSNGNTYILVYKGNSSARNVYIFKFDSFGNYQWNVSWGNESLYNNPSSIVVGKSDYIYITGTTNVYDIKKDFFVAKFDTSGNLIWNRTWGTSDYDISNDIGVDNQGNVFITGYCNGIREDAVLIKYNSSGHLQWNQTWKGEAGKEVESKVLDVDSEGNIYIGVETLSWNIEGIAILCYNNSGSLQWNNSWGSNYNEYLHDLTVDSEKNVYLCGTTKYETSQYHFFLVKFGNDGLPEWSTIWGGPNTDFGKAICVDSSNNVYFTGITKNFESGLKDIYIAKYSPTGTRLGHVLWDSGKDDSPYDITYDKINDKLYVAGGSEGIALSNENKVILLKIPALDFTNNDDCTCPQCDDDNNDCCNNNNDTNEGESSIPAYDIFILIGIISTVSVSIMIINYINKRK
ncbi:MAG: SBBP repeat-containing protein [Promethearchaeota archaeon]